jgi:hypothetical protein
VKEIGNEKTVVVRFLALDAYAGAALIKIDYVGVVHTKADNLSLLIDRVKIKCFRILAALVRNETVGKILAVEPVEAGEEGLSHVGGLQ